MCNADTTTDLRIGDRVLTSRGSIGIVECVQSDATGWALTPQPWPLVMAAVEETDNDGLLTTRHVSHWAHKFSLIADEVTA